MTDHHLLVVGASGVIGAAAVEHVARLPGWRVTAASRRRPVVADDCRFDHLPLDLTDRDGCAAALATIAPVTLLVYAAVVEAAGLVAGWQDQALIAANGRMFANALDPIAAIGRLRHLTLLQGVKAYGAHRHPVDVPLREDRPRDDHPNFYWLHEDHAKLRAAEAGFAVTIFRPGIVFGGAPGAAMNPVAAIGAYMAICRELGQPLACPGQGTTLWEAAGADLLAEAFAWAATTPAAAGQTYNIANGDVFVLRHAWPELAAAFADYPALDSGDDPLPTLADFFAAPESQAAWTRLAARHDLRIGDLPSLLGQSHHYVDLLTSARVGAKSLPVLLSTIKLRQAGFVACRDSAANLHHWLDRMADHRLLPPFRTSNNAMRR